MILMKRIALIVLIVLVLVGVVSQKNDRNGGYTFTEYTSPNSQNCTYEILDSGGSSYAILWDHPCGPAEWVLINNSEVLRISEYLFFPHGPIFLNGPVSLSWNTLKRLIPLIQGDLVPVIEICEEQLESCSLLNSH